MAAPHCSHLPLPVTTPLDYTLVLSHLCEPKFKHSFKDTLNPFCLCDFNFERNIYVFLYWTLFSNLRCTLLSTVSDIDSSLTNTNDSMLSDILLFGKVSLNISANTLITNANLNYIISTNRFEESPFCCF